MTSATRRWSVRRSSGGQSRAAAAAISGCDARTWSPSTTSTPASTAAASAPSSSSSVTWPRRRSGLSATIVSSLRGALGKSGDARPEQLPIRSGTGSSAPIDGTPLATSVRPTSRATAGCRASRRGSVAWRGGTGSARAARAGDGVSLRGSGRRARRASSRRARGPARARSPVPGRRAREEPHPLALQTTCCERKGRGRGGVEPLDVVEGHEQAIALGERAEGAQEAHRDGVRRRGTGGRRSPEQRDLERLELRRRKCVQLLGPDGVEHVDQRPEHEPCLGVARGGTRARVCPARRAPSIAASQSVVLPIPGQPTSTVPPRRPSRRMPECGELALPADDARARGRVGGRAQSRSTTAAIAWPWPMHIEAMP